MMRVGPGLYQALRLELFCFSVWRKFMKKFRWSILPGLLVGAIVCTSPARASVVNGGFENGLQGWTDTTLHYIDTTFDILLCGGNTNCEIIITQQHSQALAAAQAAGQF